MLRRLSASVAVLLFLGTAAWGQAAAPLAPTDPALRSGVLDNGIRFYILKNAKPENRVEMQLLVQAGSLQESPAEAGIAHTVEHLEFQGTEHFANQEIINFLESNGMKFGGDLNAATGFGSTVYFLNLPADKPDLLRTGLSILEDWAHGPKVDPVLFEKEKKVIAEEDRLRFQSVQGRAQVFTVNSLLRDSPYAGHLPIGDMKLVAKFSPANIRRFVDAWYTPKAMSIIVVGSLNPDAMEKMLRDTVKSKFANAKRPAPQAMPNLPEVTTNSLDYFKDTELTSNVYLYWKAVNPELPSVEARDQWNIASGIAKNALNKRLGDLVRQPDAGLMWASAEIQRGLGKSMELSYVAVPREGSTEAGLIRYLTELRKFTAFGLTKSEFELGRKAWTDGIKAEQSQNDNTTNQQKAGWISNWVLTGTPFPYTDARSRYRLGLSESVTMAELNAWIARYLSPEPAAMLVQTIDKPGAAVPDAASLAAIKAKVYAAALSANAERKQRPLVPTPPAKGSILKTETIAGTPYVKWTLSNGLPVYLYKNANTKNDFRLKAFATGGLNSVGNADYLNAVLAPYALGGNGLGDLSAAELQDFLNGKKARVNLSADDELSFISGTSDPADPADMEKFFQLLYATLTMPRRDAKAEAAAVATLSESIANSEKQPNQLYQNEITRLLTNGNARNAPITVERLKSLNLDRAAALQREYYASGMPYTFVITGDFDEAALRALVEQWLASLPVQPAKAKQSKDLGIRSVAKGTTSVIVAGHDNKATINIAIESPFPYQAKNWHLGTVLAELLDIRLREVLRQDKGGTYGVGASVELEPFPYQHARIWINFSCDPSRREEMVKALMDELDSIAAGKVSDELFAKAREIRQRELETAAKTNAYWMDGLFWGLIHRDDLAASTTWPQFYAALPKKDLIAMAAKLIDTKRALVMVLEPESKK